MNLFDSSFLCLDIGTHCVRGLAHRVHKANIDHSAYFSIDTTDTVFGIKSVIDELEKQIGAHFDTAYITGDLGQTIYDSSIQNQTWSGEHKITQSDIRNQISKITPPDGYFPMHIIPMRYYSPHSKNMISPIGHIDRQLISVFGIIYYNCSDLNKIQEHLHNAHIQPDTFYDPHFLQNEIYRPENQTTLFIDFGATFTSASIWTKRGPVCHTKIPMGGATITTAIQEKMNLDFETADRIKCTVASVVPKETDRFMPADRDYAFSRSDINDIVIPILVDIIAKIKDDCANAFKKHRPTKIILSGGGAGVEGLREFIENAFAVVTEILPTDASVRALSDYVWRSQTGRRDRYMARHDRWARRANWFTRLFQRRPRQTNKFIPIMPSTLCFDMRRPETYTLFKSGGISMIHVDIMDGFYVDRVTDNTEQIKNIRSHTNAHLHVHLMTESPAVWASDAIAAGADTIILSTGTSGLRNAIKTVRNSGRRVGIALHPESSVTLLKTILRDIDEVMVMSVAPGAASQDFIPDSLNKIAVLAATRKKYGLKFLISVDGGINPDTAQQCWAAGADLLVSGSYLAKSPDFPLAVQSLLKK